MSRSRKKHAITSLTNAKSEKEDKRIVNRKLRRILRNKLHNVEDLNIEDSFLTYDTKDISNVWDWAKDGKIRYDKDSEFYKKALRK